jgi:hypothetical protein
LHGYSSMELKSRSFSSKEPHVAREPQVADPCTRLTSQRLVWGGEGYLKATTDSQMDEVCCQKLEHHREKSLRAYLARKGCMERICL